MRYHTNTLSSRLSMVDTCVAFGTVVFGKERDVIMILYVCDFEHCDSVFVCVPLLPTASLESQLYY